MKIISDLINKKFIIFLTLAMVLSCFLFDTLFAVVYAEQDNSGNEQQEEIYKPIEPKRVLFLSSYSYSWSMVPLQIQGIEQGLGEDANLDIYYMDSKNIDYDDNYTSFYESFKIQLSQVKPYDVVIVGDDDALSFAMLYRDDIFKGTPIIFEGINDKERAKAATELADITGIIEDAPYAGTIDAAKNIMPKAKKIIAISDNTITGLADMKNFFSYADKYPELEFGEINTSKLSVAELQDEISKLDDDTILLFLMFAEDCHDYKFTEKEQSKIICDAAKIPVFRMSESGLNDGFIGGDTYSFLETGKIAGNMVNQILNGTDPNDIPMVSDAPTRYYFNMDVLKKFNIKESVLPTNSYVINKKEPLSSSQKRLILFIMVIMLALLSILLFVIRDIRRQKNLNIKLNEAKESLSNLIQNVPVDVAICEVSDKKIVSLTGNNSMAEELGYTQEEYSEIVKCNMLNCICDDDIDFFERKIRSCSDTNKTVSCEVRIKSKTGYKWVNFRAKFVEKQDNKTITYIAVTDISRLKENQIELKVQRQIINEVLKHIDAIIWEYDIQQDVLWYVNSGEEFSFSDKTIINNFSTDYDIEKNVAPQYKDIFCEILGKAKAGKPGSTVEIGFINPFCSWKYYYYKVKYSIIEDEKGEPIKVTGIGEDITDEKQRILRLKDSYQSALDICDYVVSSQYREVMLLEVKSGNMFVMYSKGDKKDNKFINTYDDYMKFVVSEVHHDDVKYIKDIDNIQKLIDILNNNKHGVSQTIRLLDDGKYKWFEVKITFLGRDKKKILLLYRNINVGVLKEKKQNEVLSQALDDAKKSERAKHLFLSNMSHEIRTPLNGIKGSLEIMASESACKEDKHLKDAMISTKHLCGLINDILDMSKIEDGVIELNPSWINISDMLDYIDTVVRPMMNEKHVNYVTKLPKAAKKIYVDESRTEQILINILSNAVNYTKNNGEVTFSLFTKPKQEGDVELEFRIKDTGCGMSQEFLTKLFKPFEQENRNYQLSGTGLGLSIVKNLIDVMGGSIHINSKVGVGTEVIIKLVAQCESDEDNSDNNIENQNSKLYFNNKKRVLIVEDNELNMEVSSYIIGEFGVLVEGATDGEIAVKMFEQSSPFYYDAIFMDIMMPNKDGYEATRDIRALNRADARHVPIIAMTANAFAEDREKSQKNGMNAHLSKPFEVHEISDMLIKYLT